MLSAARKSMVQSYDNSVPGVYPNRRSFRFIRIIMDQVVFEKKGLSISKLHIDVYRGETGFSRWISLGASKAKVGSIEMEPRVSSAL